MSEQPSFDPKDPASYHAWTEEKIRFADLDVVGHVNNNAIGVYLENARVTMFVTAGEEMYGGGKTDFSWVVARMEVDYLKEMRYPGTVRIGTRIERIGNSSVVVRQGIFRDGVCTATAKVIGVCFDTTARASMPIPDRIRTRLSQLSAEGYPG